MPLAASIPVRVAVTVGFPAVLVLAGFLPANDLAAIRGALRLRRK